MEEAEDGEEDEEYKQHLDWIEDGRTEGGYKRDVEGRGGGRAGDDEEVLKQRSRRENVEG